MLIHVLYILTYVLHIHIHAFRLVHLNLLHIHLYPLVNNYIVAPYCIDIRIYILYMYVYYYLFRHVSMYDNICIYMYYICIYMYHIYVYAYQHTITCKHRHSYVLHMHLHVIYIHIFTRLTCIVWELILHILHV